MAGPGLGGLLSGFMQGMSGYAKTERDRRRQQEDQEYDFVMRLVDAAMKDPTVREKYSGSLLSSLLGLATERGSRRARKGGMAGFLGETENPEVQSAQKLLQSLYELDPTSPLPIPPPPAEEAPQQPVQEAQNVFEQTQAPPPALAPAPAAPSVSPNAVRMAEAGQGLAQTALTPPQGPLPPVPIGAPGRKGFYSDDEMNRRSMAGTAAKTAGEVFGRHSAVEQYVAANPQLSESRRRAITGEPQPEFGNLTYFVDTIGRPFYGLAVKDPTAQGAAGLTVYDSRTGEKVIGARPAPPDPKYSEAVRLKALELFSADTSDPMTILTPNQMKAIDIAVKLDALNKYQAERNISEKTALAYAEPQAAAAARGRIGTEQALHRLQPVPSAELADRYPGLPYGTQYGAIEGQVPVTTRRASSDQIGRAQVALSMLDGIERMVNYIWLGRIVNPKANIVSGAVGKVAPSLAEKFGAPVGLSLSELADADKGVWQRESAKNPVIERGMLRAQFAVKRNTDGQFYAQIEALERSLAALSTQIGRGMGEVGVMTNQDIARMLGMLPTTGNVKNDNKWMPDTWLAAASIMMNMRAAFAQIAATGQIPERGASGLPIPPNQQQLNRRDLESWLDQQVPAPTAPVRR